VAGAVRASAENGFHAAQANKIVSAIEPRIWNPFPGNHPRQSAIQRRTQNLL